MPAGTPYCCCMAQQPAVLEPKPWCERTQERICTLNTHASWSRDASNLANHLCQQPSGKANAGTSMSLWFWKDLNHNFQHAVDSPPEVGPLRHSCQMLAVQCTAPLAPAPPAAWPGGAAHSRAGRPAAAPAAPPPGAGQRRPGHLPAGHMPPAGPRHRQQPHYRGCPVPLQAGRTGAGHLGNQMLLVITQPPLHLSVK